MQKWKKRNFVKTTPMNPGDDISSSKHIALVGIVIVMLFVMYGYYLDYKGRNKQK